MTRLRWGAITDVGRIRGNNEDQILVEEPLFAVADGMGGHAYGEIASQVAVETLKAAFGDARDADALAEAVRVANRAVWDRAHEEAGLRGMGTTLTAAALVSEDGEDRLAIVHVGDSRAYLLRDGELEQLTDDHSVAEEMVRTGQLSAEEAVEHPQRHILTRVLGMGTDIEVDTFEVLPFRGDRLLLVSDGLSNELPDGQIASVLRRLADPDEAAKELVRLAKSAGGNDNISVILIDVVDDDDRAEAASEALADAPPTTATGRREPEPEEGEPTAAVAKTPAAPPRARAPRHWRRIIVLTVVLLALLAAAGLGITAYGRGSYYVGFDRDRVTIFKGRPGGFLWFDPGVARRTGLNRDEVLPADRDVLNDGKVEPSLSDARRYVANLREKAAAASTTTTTLAPTVTTAPPIP